MASHLHTWNKEFLEEILVDTSHYALSQQDTLRVFTKTGMDQQAEAFTNIDVAVEETIKEYFQKCDPPIRVFGEESYSDLDPKQIRDFLESESIVVDPIDGTDNYIKKNPHWAISIGRIQNNEFMDGAISLPILGEWIISSEGKVFSGHAGEYFTSSGESKSTELNFQLSPLPSINSDSERIQKFIEKDDPRSCVCSIFEIITQNFDAYIGSANLWDYAACIGICRNLNLAVYYFDYDKKEIQQLPWNIEENIWEGLVKPRFPIIFANGPEHAKAIVSRRLL